MAKYGTAFFLSLLIFCMFFPKFVAADTADVLRWSAVDMPGTTGNIIVTPSEVSKIAVSAGNIIFAMDTPNSKVYRSKNGGSTWDDITSNVIEFRRVAIYRYCCGSG